MGDTTTEKKIPYWLHFFLAFKDAWKELQANDPLRMAGATAFFTTFALPAILVIIIQLLRLIFRIQHVGKRLFAQLEGVFGKEATEALTGTLKAFRSIAQNWLIAIGGFLFLLFVATTLFKIIKSSLNELWKIKPVHKATVGQILLSRLRGVLVIFFAGVLFIIDLVADAAKAFLGKYIDAWLPALAMYYNSALNYVISVVIVTIWFFLVFYFLPDGRPRWKAGLTGALVTSILFNIGKLILKVMLTYSSINSIYGASAAMVLLLLFMFYSSLIFYFGAAFTYTWSARMDAMIQPLPHAGRYQVTVEEDETT
ncbi:YihY/virulence factor BrkB family protein [Chitinophaga nivalis]|uniref:YihY/virulence factor BrkB family protein n=1 Tax=Chitinophaga nivalis TaxID=2991709 RepID=A0ABT3IGP4_9BACT|nr:YihY/virulence factor BrkB family protein [Chitinophaga nivalis]MCW3467227.1 YihY/virulence factor BrkB family protein [Chitinophaga nivalis]MCW3483081.1 YihY/virulence factor BrkB family protein [Chitinophaga nivalis]